MRFLIISLICLIVSSCSAHTEKETSSIVTNIDDESKDSSFTLADFLTENEMLNQKVESIFQTMNDTIRVGQMIVPATGRLGKSTEHVTSLAEKGWIGGILLLNGTKDGFTDEVVYYDSIMDAKGILPLIFSADAEPTLVNRKKLKVREKFLRPIPLNT